MIHFYTFQHILTPMADLGEGSWVPRTPLNPSLLPILGIKQITAGRKASMASTSSPTLAQGLDPPLQVHALSQN